MYDYPPTRRRGFHFGLRSLLVSVTLICLLIGLIMRERRQSAIELAIADDLCERGCAIEVFGSPQSIGSCGEFSTQPVSFSRRLCGDRIESVFVSGSVTELPGLTSFSQLRKVDLGSTKVVDLTPLANIRTLTDLNISLTKISDLEPLSTLRSLHTLDASFSQVMDISPLEGLSALRSLDLNVTHVCDLTPLAQLSKLEVLLLCNAPVTNLSPIDGLENLTRVDLRRTHVPRDQIEALQQRLPTCIVEHDFD